MTFNEWLKSEIGDVDKQTYTLLKQGWDAHKEHMNDQRRVVYNSCYGGFCLSPKAVYEIGKRRGITVYAYRLEEYHGDGSIYKRVDIENPEYQKADLDYSDADLGNILTNTEGADGKTLLQHHQVYYNYINRDDDDLVDTIDQIGLEAASGSCCELDIVEGSGHYEISDFDGKEHVLFN